MRKTMRRNPWDNRDDASRMRTGMKVAARKRTATLSESILQQHVVKLLQAYGRSDICWWACPNGSLRNWKVGVQLKAEGVRAGAADLMLVIDGRFHAVELKTEVGTLSAKQLAFSEDLQRAGGIYHIAFGLDQALGVLKGINAFRPGVTFSIPQSALGKGRAGEGGLSPRHPTQPLSGQPPQPVTSETGAPLSG